MVVFYLQQKHRCVAACTIHLVWNVTINPQGSQKAHDPAPLSHPAPIPPRSRWKKHEESMDAQQQRQLVLYPASTKAQKTVEEGLAARGFDVRRLNTYDTVPAEWDVHAEAAAAGVSVAAFGSPSAVKTWASRLGVGKEGKGAVAACIGETSAKACRGAGWPDSAIFYPEKPGMDGWAKAVSDALIAVEALV